MVVVKKKSTSYNKQNKNSQSRRWNQVLDRCKENERCPKINVHIITADIRFVHLQFEVFGISNFL